MALVLIAVLVLGAVHVGLYALYERLRPSVQAVFMGLKLGGPLTCSGKTNTFPGAGVRMSGRVFQNRRVIIFWAVDEERHPGQEFLFLRVVGRHGVLKIRLLRGMVMACYGRTIIGGWRRLPQDGHALAVYINLKEAAQKAAK